MIGSRASSKGGIVPKSLQPLSFFFGMVPKPLTTSFINVWLECVRPGPVWSPVFWVSPAYTTVLSLPSLHSHLFQFFTLILQWTSWEPITLGLPVTTSVVVFLVAGTLLWLWYIHSKWINIPLGQHTSVPAGSCTGSFPNSKLLTHILSELCGCWRTLGNAIDFELCQPPGTLVSSEWP